MGPVHCYCIGGDFNSKSTMWDSSTMDAKGFVLLDWMASLDFLLNFYFGDHEYVYAVPERINLSISHGKHLLPHAVSMGEAL